MNELHKALVDISSIRREVARSTQFRGYGPATLAATGAFAAVAAFVQAAWLPQPALHPVRFLAVWLATALVSVALVGTQMRTRSRRMHSGLSDEMIRMAVGQTLPSVAAGVLLTFVLVRFVPSVLWLMPGLWQVIFSIGVFSSCRFLPRPVLAVGAWYLIAGLACAALGDARALAPQVMGVSFGVGQLIAAGILLVSAPEGDDEEA